MRRDELLSVIAALQKLAEADTDNFVELTKISGLDPSTDFEGADLRGVDLRGLDLTGFNLRSADLSGALTDVDLAGIGTSVDLARQENWLTDSLAVIESKGYGAGAKLKQTFARQGARIAALIDRMISATGPVRSSGWMPTGLHKTKLEKYALELLANYPQPLEQTDAISVLKKLLTRAVGQHRGILLFDFSLHLGKHELIRNFLRERATQSQSIFVNSQAVLANLDKAQSSGFYITRTEQAVVPAHLTIKIQKE